MFENYQNNGCKDYRIVLIMMSHIWNSCSVYWTVHILSIIITDCLRQFFIGL